MWERNSRKKGKKVFFFSFVIMLVYMGKQTKEWKILRLELNKFLADRFNSRAKQIHPCSLWACGTTRPCSIHSL